MAAGRGSRNTGSRRGAGRAAKSGPGRAGRAAAARARPSLRSASRAATGRAASRSARRWSQHVTETSDALTLEEGVFTLSDPKRIADSLRDSAEASTRRKSPPFRSAMSMLVFYINRAGAGLSQKQRSILEKAKTELRKLYGRRA